MNDEYLSMRGNHNILHELSYEDLHQLEFIPYTKYNSEKGFWRKVVGYGYELFLPHVQGQPAVYESQPVYKTEKDAIVGGAIHLKILLGIDKPLNDDQFRTIFKQDKHD